MDGFRDDRVSAGKLREPPLVHFLVGAALGDARRVALIARRQISERRYQAFQFRQRIVGKLLIVMVGATGLEPVTSCV